MIIKFEINGVELISDLSSGIDISIPLIFNKNENNQNLQPNNYSVPFAKSTSYKDGQFIGDINQGGNCNFDELTLIPHCNGTHTECLGHITKERYTINELLYEHHTYSILITVAPIQIKDLLEKANFEKTIQTSENINVSSNLIKYLPYSNEKHNEKPNDKLSDYITNQEIQDDFIITGDLIYESLIKTLYLNFDLLSNIIPKFNLMLENREINKILKLLNIKSIIIRTLPNFETKKNQNYIQTPPAYLTNDAMELINSLKFKHLLIDLPSVDRQFDDGVLSSHHIFWNVKGNSQKQISNIENLNTITEMIYVKSEISDGFYLLNLQIAPFELDASPSKPIIYSIDLI